MTKIHFRFLIFIALFITAAGININCFQKDCGTLQPAYSNLITPTPVAEPVFNYDYGLSFEFVPPEQQTQFLKDTRVHIGASSNSETVNSLIAWSFKDMVNTGQTSGFFENGDHGTIIAFVPQPPNIDVPPNGQNYTGIGRGYPLAYKIKILLQVNGLVDYKSVTMTQDNLAELRQEYIDFSAATIPLLKGFDNTSVVGVYSKLVNRNDSSGVCGRHQYWMVTKLLENVSYVYTNLSSEGVNMIITSGYRCPAGNRRAVGQKNWYPNSRHTLGKAFDWDQGTNNEENSCANWEIGKYIYDNMGIFNATDIILYDQNEYEIHNSDIPEEYDQRPVIILEGTTIEAVSVYRHGHVTF